MLKKSLLISAFALSALVSNAFAQDFAELDVIVRKFPVTHHGFEMFDFDRKASGVCAGSNPEADNTQATAQNAICFTGSSSTDTYVECTGSKSIYEGSKYAFNNQLRYGQFDCTKPERGYINGPDKGDGGKYTISNNGNGCWSNPVYVTKNMVKQKLDYSQCSPEERAGDNDIEKAINGRYCARPSPLYSDDSHCYGGKLDEWYTDDKGGKRINYLMRLGLDPNDRTKYLIQYDYNSRTNWNGYSTQGYFPLDSFALNNLEGFSRSDMQSLDVWCPPSLRYEGGDWSDGNNKKWCGIWADVGGANYYQSPGAAIKAVDEGTPVENDYWGGKVPAEKLHAYSFTMAGSGEFKYIEGERDIFEFIGDDDMWIFIDGELAADLGGTHLAAPAKINIEDYAKKNYPFTDRSGDRWENGSKHAINFFYAERQTDGSNMKLRMSLSDLTPARFGAPYIMKSQTTQNQNGTRKILIWVSSELNQDHIRSFIGSGEFPIIMHQIGKRDIWGFELTGISTPERDGANGYIYEIEGSFCKSKYDCSQTYPINTGDSLSFNVKIGEDIADGGFKDDGGFGLSSEGWYIKSKSNISATTKRWALNETSQPPIDPTPIVVDPDPKKPEFDMDTWFTGNPGSDNGGIPGGNFNSNPSGSFNGDISGSITATSPNDVVHGFGEKGVTIPSSRAGELILTVYPNAGKDVCINGDCMTYAEWDTSEYKKNFGLPPEAENGKAFGILDPTEQQQYGGYAFVKNGFSNESSINDGGIQVAPTRCTSQGDESKPEINCLSFSFPAKQPFQVAVTVFDQLGNFVTQYREAVSTEEFRQIVQTPTFTDPDAKNISENTYCKYPESADDFGSPNTLTTNGMVMVNVNIYPFSTNGRRFGNGVYILKIDRVDLPYDGCMSANNAAIWITEGFVRYHSDTKFGWLRAGSK